MAIRINVKDMKRLLSECDEKGITWFCLTCGKNDKNIYILSMDLELACEPQLCDCDKYDR